VVKNLRKPGILVEVTVANPFWDKYNIPQPNFRLYKGVTREPFKWVSTESFCMSGDEHIDTRVIQFKNILKLKIGDTYIPDKEIETLVSNKTSADKIFKVKGSKGDEYVVTYSQNKGWSCTCTGFGFRSKCKHIESKRNEIK
jgi:hypothetical protein